MLVVPVEGSYEISTGHITGVMSSAFIVGEKLTKGGGLIGIKQEEARQERPALRAGFRYDPQVAES